MEKDSLQLVPLNAFHIEMKDIKESICKVRGEMFADEAIDEYGRFIQLHQLYPMAHPYLVPGKFVDLVWKAHMANEES